MEELIQKASLKCKNEKKQNHRTIGLSRAIRKWERFKEDLIDSMVVDTSSSSSSFTLGNNSNSGTVTNMVKKRKLDVTLCVMDFYQHESSNKKIKSEEGNEDEFAVSSENDENSKLHSAMLCLLKNYAYSKVIDTSTANQLLIPPSQNDSKSKLHLHEHYQKVGELLNNNASAIISLLGNLFKTGSFRLRSMDDRGLCAKLIAISVIAIVYYFSL